MCVYCLNIHIAHTASISMHCYNEVSCYTLYRPTLYKQWQCIIQLLLPIPCWCIKCESYVRIFFRIYTRSCMTLVRRYFICAVLCAVLRNSSRTHRVWSRCMRDALPSLFIFAVLSAVLRSGFRDTVETSSFWELNCSLRQWTFFDAPCIAVASVCLNSITTVFL